MGRSRRGRDRVVKLCGADVELGNFVLGAGLDRTAAFAARALLREVDGYSSLAPVPAPRVLYGAGTGAAGSAPAAPDPQDWGRKFLASNGGCVYIDLDHLELATPEVVSAWDHVAAWHAMLRIAQRALAAANAKLPTGLEIQALVNNSDGRSNAYGSHTSFLLTRRAWENIFERRLHHLSFLAAYQVSSIVFTGQGKVGAENGAGAVDYQIAQRADFFETLVGPQTTHRRPIVNARDEALCGERAESAAAATPGIVATARLHCIFFDSTLCQVATLLKVGVMQIVLAMIEAEAVDAALTLEDPLDALVRWSHDPTLRARARTVSGRKLTAVELQLSFVERARRFVDAGGCVGTVPRAGEILTLWADTLDKLQRRDLDALAARLDWVLKLSLLRRALERRPHLGWQSAETKMLDHLYASLDPRSGLHWASVASGATEQVVTAEQIARREHEPPADTRAFGRARLLRAAGRDRVAQVDWDGVRILRDDTAWAAAGERVDLADPLSFTRARVGHLFDGAAGLDEILDQLAAPRAPAARSDATVQSAPYAS